MSRHHRRGHHENTERWLVSYADFITLLFAFFTTLYAISNVDAQKMGRMVLSMQAAFDPGVFPASNTQIGLSNSGALPVPQNTAIFNSFIRTPALTSMVAQGRDPSGNLQQVREDINRIVEKDVLQDKVKVSVSQRGVVVSLAEAGFFDSGSATVKDSSRELLDKIAVYLKSVPNNIRVEGHTDNVPIHTARYPSNWELSTARATSIIAYLVDQHGFDPVVLSAAGYGEYHPADTNGTDLGRARNRRVDVVILTPQAMAQEPGRINGESSPVH